MSAPKPRPASTGQALPAWLQSLGSAAPWRALQRRFDQCAPRERALLIGAAAAVVLMLADTLARSLIAPQQLPVGVLTALIGVPVFLFLLSRQTR